MMMMVTLDATKGEGMQIRSAFVKEGGQLKMQITIENNTMQPLSGFAIQFNKNSFGLVPESPAAMGACLPQQIMPGSSGSGSFNLLNNGPLSDSQGAVQMAIKTNVKVSYFQDIADVLLFLTPDGKLDLNEFATLIKDIESPLFQATHGLSRANRARLLGARLRRRHLVGLDRRHRPAVGL